MGGVNLGLRAPLRGAMIARMIDWLKKLKDLNLGSLAEYIPQTGIQSISWVEFLKQAGVILKTMGDPAAQKKWKEEIAKDLSSTWRVLPEENLVDDDRWSELSPQAKTFWGEQIFELFFRGLLLTQRTNLDFRSGRFSFSKDILRPHGAWELSRFYLQYNPEFSKSMTLFFQGYYEQRPKVFRQSLINLGFIGQEQDSAEIEKILQGYFGEPTDSPTEFKLASFKKSFLSLFNYLGKHNKKIPANFVWMGLCLAGIYETLESLNSSYSARAAYHRVMGGESPH